MPKSRYVDFRAAKQAVTIVQILDHYHLTERFQRKDDSLSGPCPIHKGENATSFRVSVSTMRFAGRWVPRMRCRRRSKKWNSMASARP